MMVARPGFSPKAINTHTGTEHNIQKTDEARFRRRNELGPLHEEDEGEADRGQAEHEQDREIVRS